MENFKIVTCADTRFFKFLRPFENNVRKTFGRYPVIYDIGLTHPEKETLRSDVISLNVSSDYAEYIRSGIKATHKAICLLDCFTRFRQPTLYVDVDILFTEAVLLEEFRGADFCVTPLHPKEAANASRAANGCINSGVLFFNASNEARALLTAWMEASADAQKTDQQALSEILQSAPGWESENPIKVKGASVLKLDACVYNDIAHKTGKIWHFKNAGRKANRYLQYRVTALSIALLGRFFSSRVRDNRARFLAGRS